MNTDEEYWKRLLNYSGKNYQANIEELKRLLIKNRGYVYEKPLDETVIILFSGGMDSTILIDLVIKKWNCNVILLYFLRDAKNEKWENEAVDYFYDFFKKRYQLLIWRARQAGPPW